MEFPNLGKHCEHPGCRLLDFLPFKCDACKSTFCLDHHKYADHDCKIGRTPKNVECKTCPKCSQVVGVQPSMTPEQSLQKHISLGCPQERKRGPRCVECQKSQLVPMHCSTCHECVCAKHRHPKDHSCGAKKTTATKPAAPTTPRAGAIPSTSVLLAPAKQPAPQHATPQAPSSPTLPVAASADTIAFNLLLSSDLSSSSTQNATPCRVLAKKSWNVETAVRALSKNFNLSPEGLCLLMSGSDSAIDLDLPLELIAEEIQNTVVVLDRQRRPALGQGTSHSRAVEAN